MTLLRLARLLLVLFAIGLGGFGLLFLVSPTTLTSLAEIALPTPVALMEIRGVYGGMFLGVAALLIMFAREDSLRPGMVALASINGGLVLGRTLGLILNGAANALIYALYGSEIVALIVAVLALRRLCEANPGE